MASWFATQKAILLYWVYSVIFLLNVAASTELTPYISRRDVSEKEPTNSAPLTSSIYNMTISQGIWFVKFYVPWCPHCQELAPIWRKLSLEFKEKAEENDFHFGEVNCDEETSLKKRFEITGYPTLLLFRNGKIVEEFYGATDTDSTLRLFIAKIILLNNPTDIKRRPKWVGLSNISQEKKNKLSAPLCQRTFKAMISSGWNFVKFSEQDCPFCAETEPSWYQFASENPDFSLSHVDCTIEQELCKKESIKNTPSFKLFNDGETIHVYPGDGNRTVESFKEFVESGIATKPTTEPESGSGSALDTWTSDSSTGSKKSMKFRDMTSALASNNFTLATKEGIWFVLFQAASSKNSFEFAFYHLSSEFTDLHPRYGIRFATVNCATEKGLCMEKDTSDSSSIQVFHLGQRVDKVNNPKSYEVVKTYIREKVYSIKKTLRFPLHHFASQRTPNPDGKLMTLTDGVFDMLTKDGPWFVFFKSSRCLDCRAIESDWEKLATQFKDSINIAMVQCSTEEALCARLNISTYPYLRFFKDGAVRDYNGPSDMESLSSFVSLASRPHIHTVTKNTFPNIQQRESSYFLYTYNDEKDLEALEPIVKGKYLLLDIYAIPAKEYADTSNVPKTLPHLQVFHDDVSTSSLSVDVYSSAVVQDWLTNIQYNSVTFLDLTNFDLVMDQHEYVVLAVIDPLKDKPVIDSFTASSVAYKPHGTQKKPLFALLDGIKWHEYVDRVYHKSSNDLPFVAIVDSKQNIFKLDSKDGTPLPFKGDVLFQELDQPITPSIIEQARWFGVSPNVGILLCGLAVFLFILYLWRIRQVKAVPSHDYNALLNEE